MTRQRLGTLALAGCLALFASGCKKKVAVAPPPPAPPPAVDKPVAPPPPRAAITSLTVEPNSIQAGQSATLRWSTTGSSSVTIEPGVGTVPASGTRTVSPSTTTTYVLNASGAGGNASDSVTLTVTPPPAPPPPPPSAPKPSFGERLTQDLQDAYFDYDQSSIREDARAALTRNADALRSIFQDFPGQTVVVEGHADERGSAEYNLGLSDRRSVSAKEFLVQLGVPTDRLVTRSYGKENPACTDASEECWQRNRRAHFAPGQ